MRKLFELEKKEKYIQYQIKKEKDFLHRSFFSMHKRTFLFLDLLFVLGILFNFGALSMTNIKMNMDMEETAAITGQKIVMVEMNPVVAKQNNYKPATKEKISSFWKAVLLGSVAWLVWIYAYIYFRRGVFSRDSLTLLMVGVVCFVVATGMNFFNDLGVFI